MIKNCGFFYIDLGNEQKVQATKKIDTMTRTTLGPLFPFLKQERLRLSLLKYHQRFNNYQIQDRYYELKFRNN